MKINVILSLYIYIVNRVFFFPNQAKPYKNDPEILAMTNLVSAYQNNDIIEYEKILKTNHSSIMDDPFIREHIDELLQNIRTQVLIKLIKLYTRICIPFISKELNSGVLAWRIPGMGEPGGLLSMGSHRVRHD